MDARGDVVERAGSPRRRLHRRRLHRAAPRRGDRGPRDVRPLRVPARARRGAGARCCTSTTAGARTRSPLGPRLRPTRRRRDQRRVRGVIAMDPKIKTVQDEMREANERLHALVATATKEDRDFTDEENAEKDALVAKMTALDGKRN